VLSSIFQYLSNLEQQVLVDVIDIGLALAEDNHRRGGLLQALEQVHDFGFFLYVFHLLCVNTVKEV
jgi:hypothetical protein